MAQQTFTSNATASLIAFGRITMTGSISWTEPSLPSGAISWDSIVISGTWTWTGSASITSVTINNIKTTDSTPFSIELSTTQVPSLSIKCVGKSGAVGSNFSWTDLKVTYTCTVPDSNGLFIKQSGLYVSVQKVYKKISGVWVEQSELSTLFDTSTNYVKKN